MSARRDELAGQFAPAIARLRAIAAEAADALLTEGRPNPDYRLLDLCADVLHIQVHAERALAARPEWCNEKDPAKKEALRAISSKLFKEWQNGITAAKPGLVAIGKIKATTPAGIYAKALCVRASKTGAPVLAMSLAEDLLTCEGLRSSLWPAEDWP